MGPTFDLVRLNNVLDKYGEDAYFNLIQELQEEKCQIVNPLNCLSRQPFLSYHKEELNTWARRLVDVGIEITVLNTQPIANYLRSAEAIALENGEFVVPLHKDEIETTEWFDEQRIPYWRITNRLLRAIAEEDIDLICSLIPELASFNRAAEYFMNEILIFLSKKPEITHSLIPIINHFTLNDFKDSSNSKYKFNNPSYLVAWYLHLIKVGAVNEATEVQNQIVMRLQETKSFFMPANKIEAILENIEFTTLEDVENLFEFYSKIPGGKSLIQRSAYILGQKKEITNCSTFYLMWNKYCELDKIDVFLALRRFSENGLTRDWKFLFDWARGQLEFNHRHWMTGIHLSLETSDWELFQICRNNLAGYENMINEAILDTLTKLGASGAFQESLLLLQKMKSLQLTSSDFVTQVIKSSSFSSASEIRGLIDSCMQSGIAVSQSAFNSYFNRLARGGRFNEIVQCIEAYESLLPELNPRSNVYYATSLQKIGREEEGRKVLDSMLASPDSDLYKRFGTGILEKYGTKEFLHLFEAFGFELNNQEDLERQSLRRYVYTEGVKRRRDLAKEVKELYDDDCQFCGESVQTPFGKLSEAAHIQGLGSPHFGIDDLSNLLCLCPNHHLLFDNSGFYLNDDFEVIDTVSSILLGKLKIFSGHQLSISSVKYQRAYALSAVARSKRKW